MLKQVPWYVKWDSRVSNKGLYSLHATREGCNGLMSIQWLPIKTQTSFRFDFLGRLIYWYKSKNYETMTPPLSPVCWVLLSSLFNLKFDFLHRSYPKSQDEWTQLLQQQRQLHESEIDRWKEIISTSIDLIDQVKKKYAHLLKLKTIHKCSLPL